MQVFDKPSRLNLLIILLFLVLTGCTPPAPTPVPTVIPVECNEQSLIDAMDDANLTPSIPTEIQLPHNCVYTLKDVNNTTNWNGMIIYNGLPIISSEITIRGNNAVIDIQPDPGEHHFGHFFLDSEKKLNLYDLTLSNGARYIGGAVINNQGELTAYNVKFLNNMAYPESMDNVSKGGAIYSYFGKVRIMANSLFHQNWAGQTLTTNPNFGGAVYSFNSSLSIRDSYFLNNYAAGFGGAVFTKRTPAGFGGGLITIQNSDFSQNWADLDGGGVYVMDESEGVFIASSTFVENHSGGLGGAVFSEDSDVNINSTDFHYNQAEHGGAVYTRRSAAGETSLLRSDNDVFTNNTATGNGGAIFSQNSDLELEDGIVSFNDAATCGAIQLGGPAGVIAAEGDLGTALMIDSSSKIFSSLIASNVASSGYGGGVCHLTGELDIHETTFDNNQTLSYGGGLISMDKLYVTDSEFIDNVAERGGGGLAVGFPLDDNNYVSPTFINQPVYIEQSIISENLSWDAGAGIWIHHGGTISIIKSTIADNISSTEGGGIYLEEGDLFITNSTLAENSGSRGGGLYNVGGGNSKLHLTHTTIAYNIARDEGSDRRAGGGGVNINGKVYMNEALIVLNTNNDCRLNDGLGGDYEECPNYYCAYGVYGTDSDGTCGFPFTEPVPEIDSFNGTYIPIQAGSPLIDRTNTPSHCSSSDDQIGTARYQGSDCESGSIEYISSDPPPPPLPPTPELSDETANCDPFTGLDISVRLLNINPNTMSLPIYLRFPGAVPDLGPDGSMPYWGTLGSLDSFLCNQQGFEDRLYCMFTLQPSTPGTLQELEIYKEDCPEPVFTLTRLTIPEVPNDDQPGPGTTCQANLGPSACAEVGGAYMGDVPDPFCSCP
jgi:predicted outer membrane repeat protein